MSIEDLVRQVRNSRFGCLDDGCDELRDTYAEINEHMNTTHPALAEG